MSQNTMFKDNESFRGWAFPDRLARNKEICQSNEKSVAAAEAANEEVTRKSSQKSIPQDEGGFLN